MYRPPRHQKHALPVSRPPTAEQAARARLFQPLPLRGDCRLEERTWVPAMVPWRATEDGFVTPEVLAWYERFAAGQPGAIVVEATGIRDVPSGPLLRIGHDRFVPGLAQLVQTVRDASRGRTRLFIQIIDFLRIRRRPQRERFLREFLVISDRHRDHFGSSDDEAVRSELVRADDETLAAALTTRELEALQYGARERVWDLHEPHIRRLPSELPELFVAASRRAASAGFDGVELHFAHAYTMASFLSALNDRDDGYGGDREGRLRLPREVVAAVRAALPDAVVGCRLLCDEVIAGGSRVHDAAFFAVALARAGLDYVSLSTGGKFEDAAQPKVGQAAYPYTGESGWECMPTVFADERGPFGRNIAKQGQITAALRAAGLTTPTVICGGINAFEQAEGYLASGQGDIIGAARQSLADPDWFKKLRLGRGREIRRCIYRNYCEALDQKHAQVTCQLWDRVQLDEPEAPLTEDGKRRLVAPPWTPR